jgi:O-antigen/teichoic acid export membrane protein
MTVLFGINHLGSTILISRDRPRDFTLIAAAVAVENVVLNVILIPKYGADATAFNAALSGVLLAGLSMWLVGRRFGRINLVRTFGGPTLGALAMTAAVLPTGLPFVPAAILGLAAYFAGLLLFERLAFPADYERLRAMARRRGALAPG